MSFGRPRRRNKKDSYALELLNPDVRAVLQQVYPNRTVFSAAELQVALRAAEMRVFPRD